MESRYGLTGNEYAPGDLMRPTSDISGTDFTEFFSRYIVSTASLPVKECLSDAGFDASIVDYGGEVYISHLSTASASALEIRRQLLTGEP
jgi:hypothetical protein